MLPDGILDGPWFPRKAVVDATGNTDKVPYDNFIPGFFWDMAMDAARIDRVTNNRTMDPNALADRLQAALELSG